MVYRTRYFLMALVTVLLGGCGSPPENPPANNHPRPHRAQTLDQKLQGLEKADMSPNQRQFLENQAKAGQDRR